MKYIFEIILTIILVLGFISVLRTTDNRTIFVSMIGFIGLTAIVWIRILTEKK